MATHLPTQRPRQCDIGWRVMIFWARWKAFRWRSGSSSSSRRAPRSCSSLHAVL